MTVTVDLSEDTLARLQAEATRRGDSIDLVIAELTASRPTEHLPVKQTLSFVGLGSSSSDRFPAEADRLSCRRLRPELTLACRRYERPSRGCRQRRPDHNRCVHTIDGAGPLVTTALVIAETAHLVGRQISAAAEADFSRLQP